MEESERVNNIAKNSLYAHGASKPMIEYTVDVVKKFLKPNFKVLELGPAEGVATEKIFSICKDLTLVEGSEAFAEKLKEKFPEVRIIISLFEDIKINEKFDFIVLGHVLEHVIDPVQILKKCKNLLKPNGKIFAAVPNSNSIHRQAAVLMGLLEKENSLNELDIHHGHRRVYSISEFKNDFIKANLNVRELGGYWLKPVSNKQIEESWSSEMINAFMKLGEKYPEIAAEIYILAGVL